MMQCIASKKGIAQSAVAVLVLFIFAMVGATVLHGSVISQTEDESDVLKCKFSVTQRGLTNNPFTGSLGELQCTTMRRRIDANRLSNNVVMSEVSDYLMRCWEMFGEGTLRTLGDGNLLTNIWDDVKLLGRPDTEAFCFVCYDLEILNLNGDINEGQFRAHLENTVYKAENLLSCQPRDEECQLRIRDLNLPPCQRRGGECRSSCTPNLQVRAPNTENWLCRNEDDICCVERNDVFTYFDFVRFHSGARGTIELLGQPFSLTDQKNYAVVYMEPRSSEEVGFVAIGDFESVRNSNCIQR